MFASGSPIYQCSRFSGNMDARSRSSKFQAKDVNASKLQQYKRNLSVESGVTRGELEMPELLN